MGVVSFVTPAPRITKFTQRVYTRSCSIFARCSTEELRDLYSITESADMDRAESLAKESARNLSVYLRSKPIAAHNQLAFEKAMEWRSRPARRQFLCIDAGCGTGRSTALLAKTLPDCDVIGVDKSQIRLERTQAFRELQGIPEGLNNALLLRADLVDFWRLCLEHQMYPEYQFILYPNPYPKARHIKRRWHGHPIFPIVAALGGRVEVRSSWNAYLREFVTAFQVAYNSESVFSLRRKEHTTVRTLPVHELTSPEQDSPLTAYQPLTNFEAKYTGVGLPLYRTVLDTRPQATHIL